MATMVSFSRVFDCDGTMSFRFSNGDHFYLKSLNDGVMVIDPGLSVTISSFAEGVAGCFEKDSNFYGVKAIEFDFNGAYVTVTAKNAETSKIVQQWKDKMEENRIKYEKERQEYMKTPEYRAKRAKALKLGYRKNYVVTELLEKKAMALDMQFKDDEARKEWEKTVEINSHDGYSSATVGYAEKWAKLMQYLLDKHEDATVWKIAENASHLADTDGITGFMYGCAVNILSHVWVHGEELRRWHNKDYGYEGDGVVNPAVLTVNVG